MKLLVTASENEMIPAMVTGTSKTWASRFSTPKSTTAPMRPDKHEFEKAPRFFAIALGESDNS